MLGPSVIAMLSGNELDVLDMDERRGLRLTLPKPPATETGSWREAGWPR